MNSYLVHLPVARTLAIAAATVVVAFTVSVTAAQRPESPAEPSKPQLHYEESRTAAQLIYPDAPDGVDPITTGPVSQEFRERQKAARCDEAVWPDIPITCYP